jgi:hypothetical protein
MVIVQSEAEPTPTEVSTAIVAEVGATDDRGPVRVIGLD